MTYFKIIFLLFFQYLYISQIKCSKLKNGDRVSLIRKEYDFDVEEYNISLFNRDSEIYKKTTIFAYISSIQEDSSIFDYYSVFYNNIWIFLCDNKSTISELLETEYEENSIKIKAILVPDYLNYSLKEEKNNNNENIPIFEIDSNLTKEIKNYDVRTMKKEISFRLKIHRLIESYPVNYLLIVSILFTIIGIGLLTYWNYLFKVVRNVYILSVHKLLKIIIHENIFLGFALIVKSITLKGVKKDDDSDEESSIFINAILIIIDSVYRTALWFFIILTAHGWGISTQELGRDDYKFFFKMLFIIYVIVCLDQLIDSVIENTIWVFYLSELKNILFYIYLLVVIIKKLNKNIVFLKRKYYYAMLLSPEYINAILYKIRLIKKLKIMISFYLPAYLITLILHKTVFYKYDDNILEIYDYLVVDLILEVVFLFILRPKELPDNYNVDFGEVIEEENGLIYNYKLPNYWDAFSFKDKPSNKKINECQENGLPIVIIGPNNINPFSGSFIRSGPDVGGLGDSQINKYFYHLQIGYSTK